jgi:diketogulonate reductase-like aldo/keto reductase
VHAALLAAEKAAEATNEAAIPPAGVGLLAFGALVVLLAVTYAFRSVGLRHIDRAH